MVREIRRECYITGQTLKKHNKEQLFGEDKKQNDV